MTFQPYNEQTASPRDRIAWALCQIIDDDAPMCWTRYRFVADCITSNERLVADLAPVLKIQRDSLRDALVKVLDTHNREAKASMSYSNARENFSCSDYERSDYERAILHASEAEREARVLLLTLRD